MDQFLTFITPKSIDKRGQYIEYQYEGKQKGKNHDQIFTSGGVVLKKRITTDIPITPVRRIIIHSLVI